MRDFNFDSRLFLIAGCPLVALALLSGGALSAASGSGEPTAALQALGIVGLVCLVVGLLVLLVLGPRISGPKTTDEEEDDGDVDLLPTELETVIHAAETLAQDRLPALVKAVGEAGETEMPNRFDLDLPEGPHSRLGDLLNEIQESAHRAVAVQHEAIQGRLGDVVVNLVRRNQSLLDRQLESIDELETSEENPGRLEQLYGLDLLATRMRRNAESLLVLAGSEPPRRRNGPVSTADIVRVAISEIENYRQVTFNEVEDALVVPGAVVDIAHLLSELLENATSFSPPDSSVHVEGRRTDDGYEITVRDSGIGLSPDQAEQFNRILASPPGLSFDMSRSLGLMVVGRLAQRHALDVALTPGSPMGTTATISVPASLLSEQAAPEPVDATGIADTSEEEAAALPLAVRGQDAPDITITDEDAAEDQPATAAKPEAGSSDALARLLGLPTSDAAAAAATEEAPETAAKTKAETQAEADAAAKADEPAAADRRVTDAKAEATPTSTGGATADEQAEAATDEGTTADAEAGAAGDPEATAANTEDAADTDTDEAAKPTARKASGRKATKRPAKRATKRPAKTDEGDEAGGDEASATPARKQTRKAAAKRRPARKNTARKQPAAAENPPATDGTAVDGTAADGTAAEQAAVDAPTPTPTSDESTPGTTPSPATAGADNGASADERPETLEDAVPTGATFDSAIENLLDPEIKIAPRSSKGPSGLKRRDRSKSYAPEREGREIPEKAAATPAATASSRKPEEIRSLLSTYRAARKKPIDDAASGSTDALSDENGAES